MRAVDTSLSALTSEASVSLSDKLRFLSTPESYDEHAGTLSIMQTHHAWLFFTQRHVFKMKKPVKYGRVDYSTLESRHHVCNEEYRLNRRLAKHTYLGVVPLVINQCGQLELDAKGRAVEWLVKMHRLPRRQMLNVAAPKGLITEYDICHMMQKLLHFYQIVPVFHFAEGNYAAQLRKRLAEMHQELLRPRFALPLNLVQQITGWLGSYIDDNAHILERRQKDGYIREVHGDLRPEHVCFLPQQEPEIIDCLEFDPELRRLDCIEELASFGMECRHMGIGWVEHQCIDFYRSNSGDSDFCTHLWNFYAAFRATTRAMLSAAHVLDSIAVKTWTKRARIYLNDAQYYIGQTITG